MTDSMICKCGHSKYEHNAPDSWEDEDMEDTFCFHKGCTCEKYESVGLGITSKEESIEIKANKQIEDKQKKEIIDIIQDILKNKAWTLKQDGEMIYAELKKRGYLRLK